MRTLLSRLRDDPDGDCRCRPALDRDTLAVDASDCPNDGSLAESPACRATVVDALTDRDVSAVRVRTDGVDRVYDGDAAALLVAAGRFAEAVAVHDERLADTVRTDPLEAGLEATGRAGAVARVVAESGLAECVDRAGSYDEALAARTSPALSRSRVTTVPPPDASLRTRRELSTDAVVRIYERPDREVPTYHLLPVENRLGSAATRRLEAARQRLGADPGGGDRAPGRAVRAVVDETDPVETLTAVLEKHARGYGVLADFFADPSVSDVYATAPVSAGPLRATVDGETMTTNVRLTESGVAALASRFRRESGRAFSTASPTLDAVVETAGRRIRVAGLTEPISDGPAFAFRAQDGQAWTLPALVANGTVTADAAALLSLAVERGGATLVAGPRGAGKTTMLGALLWELPADVRTVLIEDTPELPVEQLRAAGRDAQSMRAAGGGPGLDPAEALRTALRLGEGALVVGEIRGEEAGVLYEAMRVGANASAVLGTIHGDGGADVRERVVSDLGVPVSSFGVTDLLVTLEHAGDAGRRVKSVAEVLRVEDGVRFETLFDRTSGVASAAGHGESDDLTASGRIDRGNSVVAATLSRPDESYADVRETLAERAAWLTDLASDGRTDSTDVVTAHARRRNRCPE
jgi:type IV secretory pathway ATPase VirB11/archaellum biosynthesis ATPase